MVGPASGVGAEQLDDQVNPAHEQARLEEMGARLRIPPHPRTQKERDGANQADQGGQGELIHGTPDPSEMRPMTARESVLLTGRRAKKGPRYRIRNIPSFLQYRPCALVFVCTKHRVPLQGKQASCTGC